MRRLALWPSSGPGCGPTPLVSGHVTHRQNKARLAPMLAQVISPSAKKKKERFMSKWKNTQKYCRDLMSREDIAFLSIIGQIYQGSILMLYLKWG